MLVYDVTITAIGGAAPADGFIDPKTSYSYMDASGDAPNSLANAKAKMRANRRYKNVIMQVQAMCNAYVTSVTSDGTADAAPTEIVIRFHIEHGADSLKTRDEENPGTWLTGAAALKRCVARAMMITEARNIEYFDPTVVAGRDIDGGDNAGIARGPVIARETIGALTSDLGDAEAEITVDLVP